MPFELQVLLAGAAGTRGQPVFRVLIPHPIAQAQLARAANLGSPLLSKLESIASSAVRAADKVGASLIIVYTQSGALLGASELHGLVNHMLGSGRAVLMCWSA